MSRKPKPAESVMSRNQRLKEAHSAREKAINDYNALANEYDATKVAFEDMAEDLAEERRKSAELTEMLRTITEEKAGPWFARLVGREAEIERLVPNTVCACAPGKALGFHGRFCRTGELRRLIIEGETQRQVDAAWSVALHEDPDRARYVVADGQHGMMQITATHPIRSGATISSNYGNGMLTAVADSVPDGHGGHRVNVLFGNHGANGTNDR